MNGAPVSDLLIPASIKTENHLMDFSDSSSQDFPDTVISTGAYIIFYQGGPIYHGTHVPGPVPQSSSESEYKPPPPQVSPLHAMLALKMFQERDRCYFHSPLCAYHPHPMALPKRWALPCHQMHIGFLRHTPWRAAWLSDHANRLHRVCLQFDLVEEASEDIKGPL